MLVAPRPGSCFEPGSPGFPRRGVDPSFTTGYTFHSGGAYATMMDGSVRFIREGIRPEVLFALSSRAGGEVIASEDY